MSANRKSRQIVERIVIQGELILVSPASFGNGEEDPYVDLPVSWDAYDGRPMIPGTSLAGALRNILRERQYGYRQPAKANSMVVRLFGARREAANERQSMLIVDDALAKEKEIFLELRDGVRNRSSHWHCPAWTQV